MGKTIGVIMAVYNGRKYLYEQINSIIDQTLKVNEITIIDDFSIENSDDIIYSFQNTVECNIRYIKHTENKGYSQTFFEAMMLTQTDYIFFSDQDDIWEKDKVETFIREMKKNNNITCLSCYNTLIDSYGNFLYKEKIPLKYLTRIDIESLIKQKTLRPGMTLAITKQLKDIMCNIDLNKYESHDRLIEYVSALGGGFYTLSEYLNRYRIHDNNTSGVNLSLLKLRDDINGRIDQIKKEVRYLNLIMPLNEKNIEFIKKYKHYYLQRLDLLESKSVFRYIWKSIGILYGYSNKRIWFGDILSIIRG